MGRDLISNSADFVIVGGGCFGSFYVRQLLRGADRIGFNTLHVVDRDPLCQAAREFPSVPEERLRFHVSDWKAFLLPYFENAVSAFEAGEVSKDHYVPPTFAPHILLEIFMEMARRENPHLIFERQPYSEAVGTPVDMPLPAGTRALSFATWTCPAACIEPAVCPHTRGPKDWDMKEYLLGRIQGSPLRLDGIHVFPCRHYAMGVGTIPVDRIVREYIQFREVARVPGTHRLAMATVSSCHGLLGLVEVRHG